MKSTKAIVHFDEENERMGKNNSSEKGEGILGPLAPLLLKMLGKGGDRGWSLDNGIWRRRRLSELSSDRNRTYSFHGTPKRESDQGDGLKIYDDLTWKQFNHTVKFHTTPMDLHYYSGKHKVECSCAVDIFRDTFYEEYVVDWSKAQTIKAKPPCSKCAGTQRMPIPFTELISDA